MVSRTRSKEITDRYFKWLIDTIRVDFPMCDNFELLFRRLYETDFYWDPNIWMDENRAVDGVDLRYTYADEINGMNVPTGPEDDIPCTVLEMLIALSVRCNDWVICDVDEHYGYWFQVFIKNLGLLGMDDDNFDTEYVDRVIKKWLDRDFWPSGKGGLFPLKCTDKDQRLVDIWSQLGYFLDETYFS